MSKSRREREGERVASQTLTRASLAFTELLSSVYTMAHPPDWTRSDVEVVDGGRVSLSFNFPSTIPLFDDQYIQQQY
jgi:hypothetical protein